MSEAESDPASGDLGGVTSPSPSAPGSSDVDSSGDDEDDVFRGGPSMSRRRFMKSAAAAGVCVPASTSGNTGGDGDGALGWLHDLWNSDDDLPPVMTMEDLPTHVPSDRPGNFDKPGYMSLDAYRMMAETEREMEKKAPKPNLQKVDATKELGVSPGDSITGPLNDANLEGKMLVFPKGKYFFTQPSGTNPSVVSMTANNFGIRGPKATFVLKPGVQMQFQIHPGSRAVCGPFTIDQSAPGAMCSTLLKTSGRVDYKGVQKKGSVAQSKLKGIAGGEIMLRPNPVGGGYIRVTGWICMGGSNAGSHGWATSRCGPPPGFVQGVPGGNGCPGMGVYDGSTGTVDFIGCKLRGWENGVYASKTEGSSIRVLGGGYVNNNNGGIRVGGGNSIIDGASLLLDQRIYDVKEMPGPYKPGGIQGVNGVRSETKGAQTNKENNRTSTMKNLDLRAMKVKNNPVDCAGGMNGLIRVQGTSASGKIHNCRLENHVAYTNAILANRPHGHDNYPVPPSPYNLAISNVEIYGDKIEDPQIEIADRPNSTLKDSCIHIKGAGPGQITGIPEGNQTNVGFGMNCKKNQGTSGSVGSINASQLRNSTASLNISGNYSNISYNGSYGGAGAGIAQKASKAVSAITTVAMIAVLLVLAALLMMALIAGSGVGIFWYLSKYFD